MIGISKKDKEVWEEYTSNFENFAFRSNIIRETSIKNTKQKNTYKLLKKGKTRLDGIIDLHGYILKTGKLKLENFIINAYNNNFRNVLIITGKGVNNNGVLKKEIPLWLKNHEIKKFIISYEDAPRSLGGTGALLIRIKNKNKYL